MYSAALTRIYSYSWRASGFPGSALSGTVVMRVRNPSSQQTAAANRAAVQRGRVCRATMAVIQYLESCSSALAAGRRPTAENLLVYIYRTVWFVEGLVANVGHGQVSTVRSGPQEVTAGSFQKPPGLPKWKKRKSKTGPSGAWGAVLELESLSFMRADSQQRGFFAMQISFDLASRVRYRWALAARVLSCSCRITAGIGPKSACLQCSGCQSLPEAVVKYSGKFISGQMLFRSGSCLSLAFYIRFTYQNFLYPRDSWQCSGIRLAADS